jgi:hypothetical protein
MTLGERDKPRQGVMANTPKLLHDGAGGFIDWLDDVEVPLTYRTWLKNCRAELTV